MLHVLSTYETRFNKCSLWNRLFVVTIFFFWFSSNINCVLDSNLITLNENTSCIFDCLLLLDFIFINFLPDMSLSWLQNFGRRCWRPLERWQSGFDSCSSHTGKMIWKYKISNFKHFYTFYFRMFSSHM